MQKLIQVYQNMTFSKLEVRPLLKPALKLLFYFYYRTDWHTEQYREGSCVS